MLAGEPTQAIALAAQNQADIAAQVHAVQRSLRFAGQAIQPHALLLQITQAARQVGHRHHRDAVGRAGRGLAYGGVDRGGLVLGNHHRGDAGSSGATQAGPQVVRVLHAVQDQHQRAPLCSLHQAFQLVLCPEPRRGVARSHALMAYLAAHAVQRLGVDPAHVDALAARLFFDLGQARVLATGLDQDLAHVVGVVLDGRGDSVDADDPLVLLAHCAGIRRNEGEW